MRLAFLFVASLLAGCGDELLQGPIDADRTRDAEPTDAAEIDAAEIDAPVDAAVDAPTDAAVDAPTDGSDVDAGPTEWPPTTPLVGYALSDGAPRCDDLRQFDLGWIAISDAFTGNSARVLRDSALLATDTSVPNNAACSVAITADNLGVYLFTQSQPRSVRRTDGARLNLQSASRVLAADPDGGAIVVTNGELVRLNPALMIDPAFGVNGRVALGTNPSQRIVQDRTLTVRVGNRLRRFDLRTGAATGFDAVAVPIGSDRVLALAALPAAGVAVIGRGDQSLLLARFDALGAATLQTVALDDDPVEAFADNAGRVTVSFASPTGQLRLARFVIATGLLDPTFGSAGLATIAQPTATCPTGLTATGPATFDWRGALGAGPLLFSTSIRCTSSTTVPTGFGRYFVYTGG